MTEGPAAVRLLREGDRERWRVLWDGYLSFYRAHLPAELTERTFRRLCDADDGMLGLVAVAADDKPLGLAHLVFHATTWSASRYCYLEDLYVDPRHRDRRTARALFEAVYEQAQERGAARVYWHTQAFNGAARSLYDVVGELTSFVVYERVMAG